MPQQNFKVAIRNEIGSDNSVLELYFLDYICNSYDWWTDSVSSMVNDIVKEVKERNPKTIKLFIDSQGGDASIGLAIYNFLKNYGAKVETDVIGMAGSIASVIAMAANKGKLRMARNAFMVIHRAWGGAMGNSEDLRAAADVVDKYTGQIVDVYANRTGKSAEEVFALIEKGDYWMTGTEAVEQGFADSTYNDNADFQIAARVKSLVPDYQNIPQNLLSEEQPEAEQKSIFQSLKSEFMDLKKTVKAFIDGLKGQTTDTKVPDNLAVEVANLMESPMNTLVESVQNEVTEELKPINEKVQKFEKEWEGLEEKVINAVSGKFEERIKALETENSLLKEQNEKLSGEFQDLIGKESGEEKKGGPQNKVIGSFGTAKKD